ncbi:MAG TPA: leucine-rich repeat protein [Muribaculaceae bacterium]|nr:leucine-rich repeat protein [Muribaculaceae bacterium]
MVFENNYNPIKFNYGAFYGCESLESFTFPDKTDYVSTQMFEKCYSLKSVKLFPSIKWIPQRFFKECSSFGPEFVVPETCTSIGLSAFELCSSLKKVVINDACKEIDVHGFRACYDLADITIGKSVAKFGEGAFWNTAYFSQRDIVIRDMATFVQAEFRTSDVAGYWPTSSPTCYYSKIYIGDKNHPVTHIDIPEGATIIRSSHALFNIPEVKSITLPSTMKTLNGQALLSSEKTWDFIECWATTPPDVEDSGFVTTATYNRSTLYVPIGSVSAYKNHKNWGRFKNIVGKYRYEDVEDVTDNEAKVYAANGQIIVVGAKAGTMVDVYSIDGKHVYTGEETAIDAPTRGIYIVRVAGKTTKLAVN